MKKIFVLLFTFFTLANPVYAKNIKFIQITDVHLNRNNVRALADFVDEMNEKYYNDADFIIFTGDNIDRAYPESLELFLDTIKNLKIRTYVIPGNHDLFRKNNMSRENYMKAVRKNLGRYHSSNPNYIFKKGKIVFVTMNGVKEIIPSPNGYFKENELIWLDKTLERYKNKKVVIFQHFPLLDPKSKGHSLYKKENYLKILEKHNNVISVISGHYHENREEMHDGVYHIITQKFSDNRFYKIIEIDDDDNFVYTRLIEK